MMQDDSLEQLSAYVDDELGRDESRFLRRRIEADPALRERLIRYHAINAAARGDSVPGAERLADRVSEALSDEPSHEAAAGDAGQDRGWRRLSPILQPVGGVALAASVALGLVVAWPMVSGPSQPSQPSMDVAVRVPAEPAAGSLSRVGGEGSVEPGIAASGDTEVRRRLSPYFVNHSEHAATGRLGGTLKYARIVSHDAER